MAHILDLFDDIGEQLYTTSVGPVGCRLTMKTWAKIASGVNPDGSPSGFEPGYELVFLDATDRLIYSPISVVYNKPILPANGKRENQISVSQIRFELDNSDNYFGVLSEGSGLDVDRIEQVFVWLEATVGFENVLIFKGYLDGFPGEAPGKSIFTASPDMWTSVRQEVKFERYPIGFPSLGQYIAYIDAADTITDVTHLTSDGTAVHDAIGMFREDGQTATSFRNTNREDIDIVHVRILNGARIGEYTIEFISPKRFKVSYPGGDVYVGSVTEDFVSPFVEINSSFWRLRWERKLTWLYTGIPTFSNIYRLNLTIPGSADLDIDFPFGGNDLNTVAGEHVGIINDVGGAYIEAQVNGRDIDITSKKTESVQDWLLTNEIVLVGAAGGPDFYALLNTEWNPVAEIQGTVITFNVSSMMTGHPVDIAKNVLEKGLLGNVGENPTYPLAMAVDWASFDAYKEIYPDVKIKVDVSNKNDVFEQQEGKRPLNSLTFANMVLAHCACFLSIGVSGKIVCTGLQPLGTVHTLSDGPESPAIISAQVEEMRKYNMVDFQYAYNSMTKSYGKTETVDFRTDPEAVERRELITLPFFKDGSTSGFETIRDVYVDRLLKFGQKIILNVKWNWGISLMPGDIVRVKLSEFTPMDKVFLIYNVSKSVNGPIAPVVVKAVEILDDITDAAPPCCRYDDPATPYDTSIYCDR